jgi:hypothetical protein
MSPLQLEASRFHEKSAQKEKGCPLALVPFNRKSRASFGGNDKCLNKLTFEGASADIKDSSNDKHENIETRNRF